LLGSLEFVHNLTIFVLLSILAQTLGGIGAGLNSTCAMAIITALFSDEKELYIGILEAGIGIGLLVGPLMGAFLYALGGFMLPFWTVAGICIALYPLLLHTNKFIQEKES
jgi:DHA1 family solute carrier family 18 vesicular amine transporter 1/2